MSVINTECVVHDAKEAQRYKQMGMSDAPPKKRVKFSFHLGDVKNITQHHLDDDDETELEELTIVKFYDGQSTPVTVGFDEMNEKYSAYHAKHDQKLDELVERKKAEG